jgi:hypothetical protein
MYKVEIDFDEASESWMENKIRTDNGSFQYVCGAVTQKGGKCKNKPVCKNGRCHMHKRKKRG